MTDASLKEVIVRALIIEGGYLEEYYKERDIERDRQRDEERDRQRDAELVKRLISRGRPIDEIAEDVGLPYDVVVSMA